MSSLKMFVQPLNNVENERLLVASGTGSDWAQAVPPPRVQPVHLPHRRWEQVAVLGGPEDGATEPQAQLFTPVIQRRDVQ